MPNHVNTFKTLHYKPSKLIGRTYHTFYANIKCVAYTTTLFLIYQHGSNEISISKHLCCRVLDDYS